MGRFSTIYRVLSTILTEAEDQTNKNTEFDAEAKAETGTGLSPVVDTSLPAVSAFSLRHLRGAILNARPPPSQCIESDRQDDNWLDILDEVPTE